jgi:hypothetical protein
MDSDSSFFCLTSAQKLIYDVIRWGGTIKEVQIKMLYSCFGEFLLIILWLVQSNNESYTHLFEDWNIVVWGE